jgi:hypothetical protein
MFINNLHDTMDLSYKIKISFIDNLIPSVIY